MNTTTFKSMMLYFGKVLLGLAVLALLIGTLYWIGYRMESWMSAEDRRADASSLWVKHWPYGDNQHAVTSAADIALRIALGLVSLCALTAVAGVAAWIGESVWARVRRAVNAPRLGTHLAARDHDTSGS